MVVRIVALVASLFVYYGNESDLFLYLKTAIQQNTCKQTVISFLSPLVVSHIYIYIYIYRGGIIWEPPQNKKTKEHNENHTFFVAHTLKQSLMILLTSLIADITKSLMIFLMCGTHIICDPESLICFLILLLFSFDPSSLSLSIYIYIYI